MGVVSIGLLGAGRIASIHCAAIERNPSLRLQAVFDLHRESAKRAAGAAGAEVAGSVEDLLADDRIDAVLIATPHDTHFALAAQALRAGKHVLLEKPLATDVGDGERLAVLAAGSDRVFAVAQNLLFHPAVAVAREQLAQAGTLKLVNAWSTGWLEMASSDFRLSRRAAGGGAWADVGPHLMYTIEHLAGPIQDLRLQPGFGRSRMEGEDTCVAMATTSSGAAVSVRISYSTRVIGGAPAWPDDWRMGVQFAGTDATVELEFLPRTRVARLDAEGWHEVPVDAGFLDSFDGELADFADSILNHHDPRVTAADALRILRLMKGAAHANH